MADPIPDSLRQADITRFINRANQLRDFKPAVTYWCEYWVINQILAKQLHNADDESLAYTTNLMDRLERTKTENAAEEAITDDTVGQAYVEQFAQETFDRAEKVMRANKVTRKTADTYDAAATFFLLGNIWGQIDDETQKKVKYAKWNAARILKAIKEGKDPNESNPKEPEPEEALPSLDPNDPEVLGLASPPPAPTVEDDPETEFYRQAAAPSAPAPLQEPSEPEPEPAQSSVLDLPSVPSGNDVNPSVPQNQGYFDPPEQFPPSPLSQTGANDTAAANAPSAPSPFAGSAAPSFSPANPASPWQPPQIPKPTPPPAAPQFKPPPSVPQQPKAPVVPISNNSWTPNNGPMDDLDLPKAQKHAKWAISALNFEDVPTAVKELRNALAALGAQ